MLEQGLRPGDESASIHVHVSTIRLTSVGSVCNLGTVIKVSRESEAAKLVTVTVVWTGATIATFISMRHSSKGFAVTHFR